MLVIKTRLRFMKFSRVSPSIFHIQDIFFSLVNPIKSNSSFHVFKIKTLLILLKMLLLDFWSFKSSCTQGKAKNFQLKILMDAIILTLQLILFNQKLSF